MKHLALICALLSPSAFAANAILPSGSYALGEQSYNCQHQGNDVKAIIEFGDFGPAKITHVFSSVSRGTYYTENRTLTISAVDGDHVKIEVSEKPDSTLGECTNRAYEPFCNGSRPLLGLQSEFKYIPTGNTQNAPFPDVAGRFINSFELIGTDNACEVRLKFVKI